MFSRGPCRVYVEVVPILLASPCYVSFEMCLISVFANISEWLDQCAHDVAICGHAHIISTSRYGVGMEDWIMVVIDLGMDCLVAGSWFCETREVSGGLRVGTCLFGAGRDHV